MQKGNISFKITSRSLFCSKSVQNYRLPRLDQASPGHAPCTSPGGRRLAPQGAWEMLRSPAALRGFWRDDLEQMVRAEIMLKLNKQRGEPLGCPLIRYVLQILSKIKLICDCNRRHGQAPAVGRQRLQSTDIYRTDSTNRISLSLNNLR